MSIKYWVAAGGEQWERWSTLFLHIFLLTLLGLGNVTVPQRLEQPFVFPGGHLVSLLSLPLVNCGPDFHLHLSFLLHGGLSLHRS